ncbi:MAG: SPOR domain-containing protein [Bacteroidota bacterium]
MRKLDTFTIAIIAICLLAAGLLIYYAWQKLSDKEPDTDRSALYDEIENDTDGDYYYLEEDDEEAGTPSTFEDTDASVPQNTSTTPYEDDEDLVEVDKNGDPVEETASRPSSYSSDGNYLVLAGSFRVMSNAETHARNIRNKGYDGTSVERFDKGAYAVVLVDRFDDFSSASSLVSRLKSDGIDAYVKRK